ADVLDGDDRLVGEGGDKFHLPDCKWTRRSPCDADGANGIAVSKERHRHSRTVVAQFVSFKQTVLWIRQHVRNVDQPAFEYGSSSGTSSIQRNRMLFEIPLEFLRGTVVGRDTVQLAIAQENRGFLRFTESRRGLDERVEHRPQVELGAADDLEDLAGRSL